MLGPLLSWENGPGGSVDIQTVMPLVAALRELGVRASGGVDEITAAGLERVPFTDDWVELAIAGDGSVD